MSTTASVKETDSEVTGEWWNEEIRVENWIDFALVRNAMQSGK